MILSQLTKWRSESEAESGGSLSFSTTRSDVRFELENIYHRRLDYEVAVGALNLHYTYVQKYGARDFESLISCQGNFCGKFHVSFLK